ncbi:hypothetical protein F5B22DRAFT_388326 [Xylaria bambusicola]|uniref:uncharacterized protein n=1 Tax=Xylaria bambusicola TaxID=326684 RepID=UPI0020088D75|nr:uncharacterized protein F5B22DRAFT_388326 [Xylaria bambusicola]KAI0508706.1 hypothetical protein F5B22DRAFT_388326 [Xylaria bambusicola]
MSTTHPMQGIKQRCLGEQDGYSLSRDGDNVAVDDRSVLHNRGGSRSMRRARSASNEDAASQKQCKRRRLGQSDEPRIRSENYFRNLYSAEPDFRRLGLKYPEFGTVLKDGAHLDFADPAAVVQLTKTLLKEDFGLEITLPADRLCPPVPNRHNYILWLKDLLDSTSSSYSQQYEPERRVTGLDIGTGASLIYPLLGCAQRPAWNFIGTDIDAESLHNARENARINNLESRIRIIDRAASDTLIPDLSTEAIDFVMVNPPFYASDTELLELAAKKSRPPHSACTGAPIEMVCEGGEVRFAERLIDESLTLKDKVQWYTAMLGKQSSLEILIDVLKKNGINNFAVTAFIQGSKTRRWALAWSFLTRRPSPAVARGCSSFLAKNMLPPVTTTTIYKPPSQDYADLVLSLERIICDTMKSLGLCSWTWDEQRLRGVGFAHGNVWSRAYRRRRAREGIVAAQQESTASPLDVVNCAFGFSISISIPIDNTAEPGSSNPAVTVCWLQGDDEGLFESFSGVVRRSLRENTTRSV